MDDDETIPLEQRNLSPRQFREVENLLGRLPLNIVLPPWRGRGARQKPRADASRLSSSVAGGVKWTTTKPFH
jgi:hypothetical protein